MDVGGMAVEGGKQVLFISAENVFQCVCVCVCDIFSGAHNINLVIQIRGLWCGTLWI